MTLSIDSLYSEFAEAYSAIAFDRDFVAENALIFRLSHRFNRSSPNKSALLELFAGPAWHSYYWRKTFGGRAIAIDSSLEMRELATHNSHVELNDYLIERLPSFPSWPDNLGPKPRFNVVLAMRYSIGYLNKNELTCLISRLRSEIESEGVLVIELHRDDLLTNNLDSLEIRTRKATLNDGTTIECSWPAGPIRWAEDHLVAAMPVQFAIRPPNAQAAEYINFVSTEYAYQATNIEQACQEAGGGFSLEDWTAELSGTFGSSTILALRRD